MTDYLEVLKTIRDDRMKGRTSPCLDGIINLLEQVAEQNIALVASLARIEAKQDAKPKATKPAAKPASKAAAKAKAPAKTQ